MFQIGDQIVHPMHGAGVVDDIVERTVDGTVRQYYSLKLPVGNMKVMIPVDTSEQIGVRPIATAERAEEVLTAIPFLSVDMDGNWNRRYRENMEKIKSGNMMQVASVIKGLLLRDQVKALSTGERKMLHSAKQILISEVVLCQHVSFESVEERIFRAVS
ncbi:MAG: CarD family transcriptional regulator [Clostridiales bacterium]|nr:CarD family transcriptional regulator [Clostridiales bacterium]MCD7886237.1 CarD family transcriptional regulator [Clostridiales bacterium]MCD8335220.1 CarD family transcriptional regulator [Clostridiales bacterium]